MLSFFKNLLGSAATDSKSAKRVPVPPVEPPGPLISAVEVAHLRLAKILERLPEGLRPLVLKMPEDSVTVALPINTILKQLPGGGVKVSLATLHRQAPAGILGPLPPGDKRMVDVPLAEVFRHVKPTAFKRRADQRTSEALDSKFNLFGDAQNPYQIAPTGPEEEAAADAIGEAAPPVLRAPGTARPPLRIPTAARSDDAEADLDAEEPQFKLSPPRDSPASAPRVLAPPAEYYEPRLLRPTRPPEPESAAPSESAPSPEAPKTLAASLVPDAGIETIAIALTPLAAGWPEPVRAEIAALDGATEVQLPAGAVSAGLARGRVIFTWGQIRGWLSPAPSAATSADEGAELTLPLKVLAPAFLAKAKKRPQDAKAAFETDIPALFNNARGPAAEAEAPAVEVTAIIEPTPAPAETERAPVGAPPAPAEPVAEVVEPPAQEPPPPAAPQSVGEVFGQPDKTTWTPGELVANVAKLPGVAGAIVALQEGLLVAQSLPPDVNSETIAAFLPQIFGRLNLYSAEMKLGEVDDLLFTTHGAHCQIYRLGFIYFAVLGKAGESLPWTELRLVADELGRQTQQP